MILWDSTMLNEVPRIYDQTQLSSISTQIFQGLYFIIWRSLFRGSRKPKSLFQYVGLINHAMAKINLQLQNCYLFRKARLVESRLAIEYIQYPSNSRRLVSTAAGARAISVSPV